MRRIAQWPWQWISPFGMAGLAMMLCFWFSAAAGFPLDDSWIHQDFARTLVTTGHFAYAPGHSAAGETSPLYALLLTPPYLLAGSQPPIWLIVAWSDLLGAVTLAGLALLATATAARIAKSTGASRRMERLSAWLAGGAILTEWHLIWSSASGMETMLFALLGLLVLVLTAQGKRSLWIGILVSLSLWVRPEGWLLLVVVPPICAWTAWRDHALLNWLRSWLLPFLVGFTPGALIYAACMLAIGGSLLPTTFLAKSAEFVGTPSIPSITAWLLELLFFFILGSPLLVALAVLSSFRRVVLASRSHPRPLLARLLWGWSLAFLFVYAGRVYPGYHHSRYLLPALPPLLILAAVGAAPVLLSQRRMLVQFAGLALLIVTPFSLIRAVEIYQTDVQVINCAEVDTGQWLHTHLPPGAVIATHDVGAIGYFSEHPVLDFTGLVDPELIPLVHNPIELERYLQARHVGYVAIYQDWFPPDSSLMRDLRGKVIHNACGVSYFQVYQTGW